MRIGTLTHLAVLEPDRFDSECVVMPTMDRRTKAGKEAWAAAEADGKKLLKPDELDQIDRMHQSLLSHPGARKALKSAGKAEQSIFAVDPATGLEMKCRPDYLTDSGWVIDLKTTTDASVESFTKSTANFRYHVQAAWYLHVIQTATGERPKGFVFLAVEKTAPYAVQVFKASAELIEVELRRTKWIGVFTSQDIVKAISVFSAYEATMKQLEQAEEILSGELRND